MIDDFIVIRYNIQIVVLFLECFFKRGYELICRMIKMILLEIFIVIHKCFNFEFNVIFHRFGKTFGP